MFETRTQALARPAHLFDVPAIAAWSLAAVGSVTLRLAFALDAANARRAVRRSSAEVPRARLGPSQSVREEHHVPDTWRIR